MDDRPYVFNSVYTEKRNNSHELIDYLYERETKEININVINKCENLPKYSEYVLKNLGYHKIDKLLKLDSLIIEEFSYLIEPYLSCLSSNLINNPVIKMDGYSTNKSECSSYPDVFTGELYESGKEMFILDLTNLYRMTENEKHIFLKIF